MLIPGQTKPPTSVTGDAVLELFARVGRRVTAAMLAANLVGGAAVTLLLTFVVSGPLGFREGNRFDAGRKGLFICRLFHRLTFAARKNE